MDGLMFDWFCGGGGASLGIAEATGRQVDAAVNHWPVAIDTHAANHPDTIHLRDDVWAVRPRKDLPDGPVGIFWASPSCTHHSKAKSNGEPLSEQLRSQPDVIARMARQRQPSVIFVENVTEFEDWGPLGADGRPIKSRKGEFFRAWVRKLERCGYRVEWRALTACDYGAPTSRKRLYIVARRDGQPIRWPAPTHGRGLLPYRTAADCIDWSLPCPSIFGRKKPLAEATHRRIAEGIRRYTIDTLYPFVVPTPSGLVAPGLVQTGYGEREGQAPRALDIQAPLGTVVACGGRHALVSAWIVKHYGGVIGHEVTRPLGAVTTKDHHGLVTAQLVRRDAGERAALVDAFLRRYLGAHVEPIVRVDGELYVFADIGLRMLQPRELARAMGFPDSYVLTGTKTDQQRLVGNAVCSQVARALVEANCPRGAA